MLLLILLRSEIIQNLDFNNDFKNTMYSYIFILRYSKTINF